MLNDWMDACQATPRERKLIDRQCKLARKTRGPIPQFIQMYFDNGAKAVFIRMWALLVIPGLLQISEYACAMFLTEGMSEDEVREKTDVRIRRQAILKGQDPAHATVLIHELALYFQVGTPAIMTTQLRHLLELSRRPNVVLQVIPDTGYFPGLRGPYEIASGDAIPDTLLMLAVEDQTMEDTALTRKAIALFEHIRSYALNAEDSRALISEAITKWQSQQQ